MVYKFSKAALEPARYPVIPEGETIVRVKSVDEGLIADGTVTFVLEDRNHIPSRVNFDLANPVGEQIHARAVRTLMGNELLDEIDHRDLIGKYARVEIVHKTGSRGGTFANVKRWLACETGFDYATSDGTPSSPSAEAMKTPLPWDTTNEAARAPALSPAPSQAANDPFAALSGLL